MMCPQILALSCSTFGDCDTVKNKILSLKKPAESNYYTLETLHKHQIHSPIPSYKTAILSHLNQFIHTHIQENPFSRQLSKPLFKLKQFCQLIHANHVLTETTNLVFPQLHSHYHERKKLCFDDE